MMLKKVMMFLCCVALTFGMVGCSDDKKTTQKEKPETKEYVFVSEENSAYRLNPQTGCADEEAKLLREEIMNHTDELDTKGKKVWYISSANGNDKNDGTSPEQAWATLNAYSKNKWNIKNGDIVLFERGGIYRGDNIGLISGVSYGAYGEGAKPAIYGSKDNYSGKDAWKSTNYENVWVCDDYVVSDVGVIVFNHGQAVGVKRLPVEGDLETNLKELKNNFEFYYDVDNAQLYLYMDCNPGETFYDIEICEKGNILKGNSGSENIVIENLTIKYGGGHAIRFDDDAKNITIRNCEIGFVGGSLQDSETRYGNGIEFWNGCSDILVENNWIYQIYDAGITHQGGDIGGFTQENITLKENLLEYCSYTIEFYVGNSETDVMKNILYTDNILRFIGYGWGVVRPNPLHVSAINAWGHQGTWKVENFVIQDNIFDMSRHSLIVQYHDEGLDILYTGNSYYLKEGDVAMWEAGKLLKATDQVTMEESIAVIDKNPKTVKFIQE